VKKRIAVLLVVLIPIMLLIPTIRVGAIDLPEETDDGLYTLTAEELIKIVEHIEELELEIQELRAENRVLNERLGVERERADDLIYNYEGRLDLKQSYIQNLQAENEYLRELLAEYRSQARRPDIITSLGLISIGVGIAVIFGGL